MRILRWRVRPIVVKKKGDGNIQRINSEYLILKVHYATLLGPVNTQRDRALSFPGANMTFRCTLKPCV